MPANMKALLNQTMTALEKERAVEETVRTRLEEVRSLVDSMDFRGLTTETGVPDVHVYTLTADLWEAFRDTLKGDLSAEVESDRFASVFPQWRTLASHLGVSGEETHIQDMTVDLSDTVCIFRPRDKVALFVRLQKQGYLLEEKIDEEVSSKACPDLPALKRALQLFER